MTKIIRNTWAQKMLAEAAKDPIPTDDLMRAMGYTKTSTLQSMIRAMREKGHTVWSINSNSREWLIWYRGGPKFESFHLETVMSLLGNNCGDYYTRQELAQYAECSIDHISDTFGRLKKKGVELLTRINEKGYKEYRLK